MDPEDGFTLVVEVIDELLSKTGSLKGDIAHVATCAFWHSLLGVDADLRPTTKVFGWADRQSRKYSSVLRKHFDEAEVHDRTGSRFHSSYWPAKLLWLKKEFPDIYSGTHKWISFSDLVNMRMCGDLTTSVCMASGTGLLNISTCTWDTPLLEYLKLSPKKLPEIEEAHATTTRLNAKFSKRWPRLKQADWFNAIGDGAADNLGSGCVSKSKAALMIGTSGAMRVVYRGSPPRSIPAGLWCYRVDPERTIIGGALSDGGGLYRWLRDNLRLPDDAETEISRRPAAAHGLTFLPFFFGERSTGYQEDAAGAILGLLQSHDSVDILQAAMESVAFRFAEIYRGLQKVTKVDEIIASGGALRDSAVWTQMIADVLGRDLILSPAQESSSRGAVLLALETICKIGYIKTSSGEEKTKHRAKYHVIYKRALRQHRAAYDASMANHSK